MATEDILNYLDSRVTKNSPRLPRSVQKKQAEKRIWSKTIGVCKVCDLELYQDRAGTLRCLLITEGLTATGSSRCLYPGTVHVLDESRTFAIGRKIKVTDVSE